MFRVGKPPKSGIVVTWVCLLGAFAASLAQAETRVIVWASDYSKAHDRDLLLPNTLVDAKAVTGMFRKLKIQDLTAVENPTAEEWNAAVDGLVGRLGPDDVAVLYYAGHAVQVNGQNFFLAGDGTTLIASEQVLAPIMTKARGTVFLIDACRDNPFKDVAVKKSAPAAPKPQELKIAAIASRAVETVSLNQIAQAQGGLSQMGNLRGKNTIVLFSTDPGNVAVDGPPGKGSPFANAVVRELGKRQSLDSAIRRITADVDKQTNSRQAPWRQGDLSFPLFLGGQPRFPVP
jgi:uncharacterized caspase-like protein